MAGFSNETVYANNVNFNGPGNKSPTVTADGQLMIGSAVSPNIRIGNLTSSNSSITITNGAGTIDLTVGAGSGAILTLTGNTGGARSPTAGNINTFGSGSITIVGSGSTLTTQLTGLTNHSVLVGAGTATITSLTVGTTGQLLIGATAADPAFGSTANADFTFGGANSGATRTFSVTNTSNTASSAANSQITVGGGTAADPQTTYTVTGAASWSTGVDNSDSDAFVLSSGTALGTNNNIRVDTDGGQYRGKNTNTAPPAGFIGEHIRALVDITAPVSISPSGTTVNVTSISLTAGIWDVSIVMNFRGSQITQGTTAISIVSATIPGNAAEPDAQQTEITAVATNGVFPISIPAYRMTLSATTTVYLVAFAAFSGGTASAAGRISATRVG